MIMQKLTSPKHTRFPHSLFGRLVLVLLVGLLVAQSLGAYILLRDRAASLYEAGGWYTTQRFVGIVELMDSLPSTQRRLIVQSLNSPTLRVFLVQEPSLGEIRADIQSAHTGHMMALLTRQLGSRPVNVSIVAAEELPPMPGMMGMRHDHDKSVHRQMMGFEATVYKMEAQLSDGTWVGMLQGLPEDHFLIPGKLISTLLVLLLSVVGLSLWAVRWVTRPLASLGQAAEALGRDINRPPLNEDQGAKEVQHAAKAFNTMQKRITNYVRERERFFAAISHDLKTPITRLRLRAELLEDESTRENILHDINDMEIMTAATLEFLRGEQQHETPQAMDIMALLETLQDDRQAMGQNVEVSGESKPYAAQPMALRRCLENLMDNAIKYGDWAKVSVTDTEQQLTIRIIDHGPGIAEQQLNEVFKPFHRLESSRSRETGGVGLGLTIARGIAQAHGGDLTLRNHSEGGLEATLVLPR